MKKLTAVILLTFIASLIAFTQTNQNGSFRSNNGGSRDVTDLECPDGSLYAQNPDGLYTYSSLDSDGVAYDNVLSAPGGPVGNITWWMEEEIPQPTLTFDIFIRGDDGGKPGTLKASYTSLSITGVNTGEIFNDNPVYEYTYYFPAPLTISAGDWIGIADYPDGFYHHYWLTSSDGDQESYVFDGSNYVPLINPFTDESTDFSFCLGEVSMTTPVSDWAIGLGVFLIIAVTVLRLRRVI